MWLKYGVTPDGELKNIEEVSRGKTELTCLYCGGQLTAKKGKVKEHHFAHTGESCKPVSARVKTKAFKFIAFNLGESCLIPFISLRLKQMVKLSTKLASQLGRLRKG
jgi:hypothetical protein